MDMQSRFTLNGGKVHFDRMDLLERRRPDRRHRRRRSRPLAGADSTSSARASTSRRRKTSSFTGRSSTSRASGDFTGTFHLFKGGRELKGTFVSAVAGVNAWRFPEPARIGAVGAGSARDHERHERALRRHGALRLPDGAVRPADARARDLGRRIHGRRSRHGSRTFSRPRGCGWRAARRAGTASSGRSESGR